MDCNLDALNLKNEKPRDIPYVLTDADKIDLIIERLCAGIQKEFVRRCKVAENTPSNWKKRNSMDYRKVSKGFPEVSLAWLINGEGPMLLADLECPHPGAPIDNEPASAHTHVGVTAPAHVGATAPADGAPANTHSDCLQVREDTPFDLAWFNATLRENAQLKQKIEQLQAELTQAQCRAAVAEARIEGASAWYFQAISKHPDLKQ